jgi:hypothetical protein
LSAAKAFYLIGAGLAELRFWAVRAAVASIVSIVSDAKLRGRVMEIASRSASGFHGIVLAAQIRVLIIVPVRSAFGFNNIAPATKIVSRSIVPFVSAFAIIHAIAQQAGHIAITGLAAA